MVSNAHANQLAFSSPNDIANIVSNTCPHRVSHRRTNSVSDNVTNTAPISTSNSDTFFCSFIIPVGQSNNAPNGITNSVADGSSDRQPDGSADIVPHGTVRPQRRRVCCNERRWWGVRLGVRVQRWPRVRGIQLPRRVWPRLLDLCIGSTNKRRGVH